MNKPPPPPPPPPPLAPAVGVVGARVLVEIVGIPLEYHTQLLTASHAAGVRSMMHGYARPYTTWPHSPVAGIVGARVGACDVGAKVDGAAVGARVDGAAIHSPHCSGHTLAVVGLPQITASVSASSPTHAESTGPHAGRLLGATVDSRHNPHSAGHALGALAQNRSMAPPVSAVHVALSGAVHGARVVGAPDGVADGDADGECVGATVDAVGVDVGASVGASVGVFVLQTPHSIGHTEGAKLQNSATASPARVAQVDASGLVQIGRMDGVDVGSAVGAATVCALVG